MGWIGVLVRPFLAPPSLCLTALVKILNPVPLRGPEAAGAEEVSDGAGCRQLCITGVKHHAEVFGDNCRLSTVLHLAQIYKTLIK